jgi:hypothetical protein
MVVAATQPPDSPLQSWLVLGQSARKYFHPPQSLLTLLFARAQFCLSVVSTPTLSPLAGAFRQ